MIFMKPSYTSHQCTSIPTPFFLPHKVLPASCILLPRALPPRCWAAQPPAAPCGCRPHQRPPAAPALLTPGRRPKVSPSPGLSNTSEWRSQNLTKLSDYIERNDRKLYISKFQLAGTNCHCTATKLLSQLKANSWSFA